MFFTSFLKRSQFSSFFGAFYDCYEIAVLWFEKKMYHCFAKMANRDIFAIRHCTTILKLFKQVRGQKVRCIKSLHPDHFFALSFPVLTDRIFLCPDFTHRISSSYSNIIAPTENKQRTVISPFSGVFCIDPLKILCLVRSLVLSKRLFRNQIESNILQKHTAK